VAVSKKHAHWIVLSNRGEEKLQILLEIKEIKKTHHFAESPLDGLSNT
jgi:hypothetical protein